MTVYFIGAGPGDPELITVKGRRLIESCPVCLYAGSLVPPSVIESAPADAVIRDTAAMHLDEIMEIITAADSGGKDVARVHSGDPSLYGAIAEQIRRLKAADIVYEIVPGVPAFAAAAAVLGRELTVPEIAQTVILTRTAMKSSSMPAGEDLAVLGRTGATLAIHLSIRNTREIQRQLIPVCGGDCPVIIAYRIGWPEQTIIETDLDGLQKAVRNAKLTRTALIFVGRALTARKFRDSALYDAERPHLLRPFTDAGKKRRSDARKAS
ncbi:MAG: precorrin-4 C(11)-methyltransferase [Rhodobacteraceae bacterium]|nr:precorrin-4 C(11)-methyltransferase [Paracoccaceae bacterium]